MATAPAANEEAMDMEPRMEASDAEDDKGEETPLKTPGGDAAEEEEEVVEEEDDNKEEKATYGTTRYTGVVRRYRKAKSFGFVEDHNCEGVDGTLFLHQSELTTGKDYWAWPIVANNTKVSFVLSTFRGREQAGNITHLDGSPFEPLVHTPMCDDKAFTGTVANSIPGPNFGFIKPDEEIEELEGAEDVYFSKADLMMEDGADAYVRTGTRVQFHLAQEASGKLTATRVCSENGDRLPQVEREPRRRNRVNRRVRKRRPRRGRDREEEEEEYEENHHHEEEEESGDKNGRAGRPRRSPRNRKRRPRKTRVTKLADQMSGLTTADDWNNLLDSMSPEARDALLKAAGSK